MNVQKHDLATNKRKLGQVELADISDAAKDALGGSELDHPYRTIYVSQDFAVGGAFYDTLAGAITYANSLAYNVLIQVYPGTYTGNYYLDPNVILNFMPETFLVATDTTLPVLTFSAGAKVYGYVRIEYSQTSGYQVGIKNGCTFEFITCGADYDPVKPTNYDIVLTDAGTEDVLIRGHEFVGRVNVITSGSNLRIESNALSLVKYSGTANCYIKCRRFKQSLTTDSGTVYLNTDRYLTVTDTIFNINGGTTIANGRADLYSAVTNSTTGEGHIAKIAAGTLKLNDFYAKNGAGGVIWGAPVGTLVIANSVLQATVGGGGGTSDTIYGVVGFTVRYSGNTGINTATAGGLTEQVPTNKVQDAAITI